MTSLVDKRLRGDMIATYKVMSGKDKVDPGVLFTLPGEERRKRQTDIRSGLRTQAGHKAEHFQPEGGGALELSSRRGEGGPDQAMTSGSGVGARGQGGASDQHSSLPPEHAEKITVMLQL